MTQPLRLAVNARVLGDGGAPFARLTAAEIVQVLSEDPGFHLELALHHSPPSDSPSLLHPPGPPPAAGAFGGVWTDQVAFPRIARRLKPDLLLYLHPAAPFAAPAPTVAWFGDGPSGPSRPALIARLEKSLASAGLRGAAAVFRPDDLPVESHGPQWIAVPPIVPRGFYAEGEVTETGGSVGLPDSFVLAAGEPLGEIPSLLAAWTWVEGALGDTHTLLFACVDEVARQRVEETSRRMELAETVRAVILEDQAWPAAFHRASALLASGTRPSATPLRWAMAAGLPVAAPSTPVSDSILGPAGYLTTRADARALGAACLTLLVEDEVATATREKGRMRAEASFPSAAATAWLRALRAVVPSRPTARD